MEKKSWEGNWWHTTCITTELSSTLSSLRYFSSNSIRPQHTKQIFLFLPPCLESTLQYFSLWKVATRRTTLEWWCHSWCLLQLHTATKGILYCHNETRDKTPVNNQNSLLRIELLITLYTNCKKLQTNYIHTTEITLSKRVDPEKLRRRESKMAALSHMTFMPSANLPHIGILRNFQKQ